MSKTTRIGLEGVDVGGEAPSTGSPLAPTRDDRFPARGGKGGPDVRTGVAGITVVDSSGSGLASLTVLGGGGILLDSFLGGSGGAVDG